MLTSFSSLKQSSLPRSAVCLGSLFVLGYASWRCRRLTTSAKPSSSIPYKSPEDPKTYKYVILPNAMHVLLVSSPVIDKAGVALNVNVGHLMDPNECQGLAHFCEHMMHLGSKQFPQEDGYKAWLSAHQGRSNASTNASNTKYMFDIAPEYLKEAMERFAALFVSPLFTQSATGREVQAVHNEFAKNLNTDDRRINQVLRSWVRQDHPLSQFGTGNLDTLRLGTDGDSSMLSSYLSAFHAEHYHASSMRLVVFGRESTDDLEQWAREYFSLVPNNPPPGSLLNKVQKLQQPVFEPRGHALSPIGRQLEIVPARDMRQLLLRWPMRKREEQFREYSPHRVVSHLLGHEGPKSLLSYLKEKGWATSVSAGTDWSVEFSYMFTVDIALTQQGLERIDEIVAAVFCYISLISAADDRTLSKAFAEMKQIHDIKFRFKSEVEAFSLVSDLCRHMQDYPPHRVLTAASCLYSFSSELVREVLSNLRVDNVILLLLSKNVAEHADRKEDIYGTLYRSIPIDASRTHKWQSVSGLPMQLPRPNTLIPADFTIKSTVNKSSEKKSDFPVVLEENPYGQLWFCQDTVFLKPKLNFYCTFFTPPPLSESPKTGVLAHLYTMLVDDVLTEDVYDADLAGLKFGISDEDFGMHFWFTGYNDKMYSFVEKILPRLINLPITRFSFAKDRYERGLKSFDVAQPHSHASETISILTQAYPRVWTHTERLAALHTVTAEDMQQFAHSVWKEGFLQAMVHGNATSAEAQRLFSVVTSKLGYCPNPSAGQTRIQFTFPAAKNHVASVLHPNVNEPNSCCILLFHAGKYSIERHAALYFFSHLFRHPCFNQLRTQEQLGYLVNSHLVHYKEAGELCFRIMVQSSSSPSPALNERMNLFMEGFVKYLSDLEESAFILHRQSATNKLLEKDDNLGQVSSRFWSEIKYATRVFDRSEQLAATVRSISRESLIELWTTFFSVEGSARHSLASYSQCKKHADDESKHD